MQVDRASECGYEGAFDLKHLRRTDLVTSYEFDEHVNVAIRAIFPARDGAEYGRVNDTE
jgi:hypothetical protein